MNQGLKFGIVLESRMALGYKKGLGLGWGYTVDIRDGIELKVWDRAGSNRIGWCRE